MTQLGLEASYSAASHEEPKREVEPATRASEGLVWWYAPLPGSLRAYHELPRPEGPQYGWTAHLVRYGSVDEAEAAGMRPCTCYSCTERREARTRGRRRWQRGRTVRR